MKIRKINLPGGQWAVVVGGDKNNYSFRIVWSNGAVETAGHDPGFDDLCSCIERGFTHQQEQGQQPPGFETRIRPGYTPWKPS